MTFSGYQTTAAGQTCHIDLDGQSVSYTLKRSARKTIGFVVSSAGLEVRASPRLSMAEVETALRRHRRWILKRLPQQDGTLPALVDGAAIPFLGQTLLLRIEVVPGSGQTRFRWQGEHELHLFLTDGGDACPVFEHVLKQRARQIFLPRLEHYCRQLGVETPILRVTTARTRWGSASPRGVNLNWRLIHFAPEVIDHVVAHEVAHLREANHGARFYQLLAQLDPDHRIHHEQLRRLSRSLPCWGHKPVQTKEKPL